MYRLFFRKPCKCALQQTLHNQACRHYSKNGRLPPLPPNTREANFGKVLLFLTPLAVVGGTITYAKYNKEFRKTLENNIPGAKSLLKTTTLTEKPFEVVDNVTTQITSVTKSIGSAGIYVSSLFSKAEKQDTPKKDDVKITAEDLKSVHNTAKSAASKEKTEVVPPIEVNSPSQSAQISNLPSDIIELEAAIEVAASLALKEYKKATGILKIYNEDVRRVVDRAVENVDTALWNTLRNRSGARDTSVATAEKSAREAFEKIEKCQLALSKAANAQNIEEVAMIRDKVKLFVEHINNAKDELYKEKDLSNMSEKYWRNVEKARNYFVDEIETLFPGLNLSKQKLNLPKEDLDLFIMHAYSHVVFYQKELQRLQTDGEIRLKRAIEAYRGENDSEAVKAQIEYQLQAEKRKLGHENQKKIFQIRANAEKKLRKQLRLQSEAHVDHLQEAVVLKEQELKRVYARELEEKLGAEAANYKLQLATMLGKMRGMDAALQARADTERSAHQAQALWAACQALWATVRAGEPGTNWRAKLRPLKSEIAAISKVAEGDELVAVVLKSLPREAEERGVFPEDALRERFFNVERFARRLALVPEEGGSIPMYLLSYLQSVFILKPTEPVSKDELENKEFDYSKLDTYDILNRARYYVDRGDLLQAVKYVNLLKGAPRKLSSEWLKETRLLLETQQAANTLMAHAAASGLLYL